MVTGLARGPESLAIYRHAILNTFYQYIIFLTKAGSISAFAIISSKVTDERQWTRDRTFLSIVFLIQSMDASTVVIPYHLVILKKGL